MTGLSVNPLQISGRRPQDMWASILFALFFAATIGITCVKGSSLKNLAASCTDSEGNLRSVGLHLGAPEDTNSTAEVDDLVKAGPYLIGTAAFALLFVSIWMVLLRYFAKQVIYATLVFKAAILFGGAVYLFFAVKDSHLPALIMALIGALYILWLCCARRRIALTAKLVEQSVVVVSTHPGLFAVSGVLFVVKILSVALCFVSAVAVLASKITTTTTDEGQCELTFGELETFDMILLGVCTIFFWWTINIWLAMKRYIVSLVTGIWYYEHESLAAQEGDLSDKEHTRAPICTGVKLACSSGFGTIAFASFILAICNFLKNLVKNAQRESGNNLLVCLLACCVMCILNLFEFVTTFALSYAALTGESFCQSGKTFLGHCERHGFIKVLVVDMLARMIFNFGAFVFALLTMGITIGMVKAGVLSKPDTTQDEMAVTLIPIGILSFLIAGIIFHFVMSLLLMIVDAAYSCVVLDLDNYGRTNQFHRPAIAVVVMQKVKPDFVVVQQPGGAAIGQPVQPGQVYVQPMYAAP